jgi:hypothetical protein
MKIVVTYVYPNIGSAAYNDYARRFVSSYLKFPPGATEHALLVLVNGGDFDNPTCRQIFSPLPCVFMPHDNSGYDIGAFQKAAATVPSDLCDLMVFLGSKVHFRCNGWLDRMIRVYAENGPGLYGAWAFHQPAVHVRTTVFWCAPKLLNSYPETIVNHRRYEFEYGGKGLVHHVTGLGLKSYMTTWNGCYPQMNWHHVSNVESLLLDQHTDRGGYT